MIDEKKLIEELEKKPFIHGRYDHKNGNIDFISGIETWHETVMHEIENAPKVGEWIPCSERLPEEGEFVLASVRTDVAEHRVIISQYDKQYYWHIGYIEAWQPLPQPYKGE